MVSTGWVYTQPVCFTGTRKAMLFYAATFVENIIIMSSATHEVRFKALTGPVQIVMYHDTETGCEVGPLLRLPYSKALLQFRKEDKPIPCTVLSFTVTGSEVLYDIDIDLESSDSVAESGTRLPAVSSHFLFDVQS